MNIEEHLEHVKKITKTQVVNNPKFNTFFHVYSDIIKNRWPIESFLNIGVGPNNESDYWLKFLHRVFPTVTIFESLEYDSEIVKKWSRTNNQYLKNITHGDVRRIDEYYDEKSFDFIFWNQGPEHINREERKETFDRLERIASKAIWLHCPWGSGYDFDTYHYSKNIKKGEFEPFGFNVKYFGEENSRNAGIVSWKLL